MAKTTPPKQPTPTSRPANPGYRDFQQFVGTGGNTVPTRANQVVDLSTWDGTGPDPGAPFERNMGVDVNPIPVSEIARDARNATGSC